MKGPGSADLTAPFQVLECVVRPDVHEIEGPEGTSRLEPKAMAVLAALVVANGKVVERRELLNSVWQESFVTEEVLTHCIWELRRAFGDDARKPRYIQTVPRRGYRFLAEPAALDDGTADVEEPPSLAVLPFLDLGPDGENKFFCDGMAEELIHALSRLRGLRVLSRTSAQQFHGVQEDLREVGRRLGVDLLLEGSVRPAGEGLRTLARLVEVKTGFDLWAEAFHHDMGDAFRVQQEIARAIVTKVHGDLISGVEALGATPTGDVETYRLYLQARYAAHDRKASSFSRANDLYREALARQSDYLPALAGLSEVLLLQAVYGLREPDVVVPEARQLAEEALAIDPDRAEIHTSLAFMQAVYDWQWAEAEEGFRRAMAVDPYYATAPQWYGINCLTPQGRFEEARRYLRRAQAMDPLSTPIQLSVAMTSYFAREFERAESELAELLAQSGDYAVARMFRGLCYVELGAEGGIAELEAAVTAAERSPESIAALAYGLARGGAKDRALELLGELSTPDRYVSPALRAQVHAGLGDAAAALSELEAAADGRAADLAWLRVRPVFAPLRSDERFKALIERLRLG